MKKIIIGIIASLLMFSSTMTVLADTNSQTVQQNDQAKSKKISQRNGILLDVARYPMDKAAIKQVIDQMNPQKFSYLILHLNDDQHVAFQSKILGNQDDPNTLSASDIKEIVSYAKERQIMIVPDFDTPGHCEAFIKLVQKNHPKIAKKIISNQNTLDFSKKATIDFVKKIYQEINQAFKDQSNRYLMIGGDEVAGGIANNKQLVSYFNQLNKFENKQGYKTIVWNDNLKKKNKLNDNITVAYWSQSGNSSNQEVNKKRIKQRATVNELKQHPLINANSDYNYFMMNNLNNQAEVQRFIQNFWQNNPKNYNELDGKTLGNSGKSYQSKVSSTGQLVALWEGNSQVISTQQVIDFVKALNQAE